ncbi:peptidoglycan-binding protein [Nocardioides sp.]|uniref:L,D-transpeptidase family protein n=1 Tax=Nocardioides sp. TaxID=35761 RepID=UPI003513528C
MLRRSPCRNLAVTLITTAVVVASTTALTTVPRAAAHGTRPAAAAATRTSDAPRSPALTRVQQRLQQLRCDPGPADGRLGDHTRSALVRVQTRHGLRATGQPDAPTRRLLASARAQRCDLRPVPRASGRGRRVVLSQRQSWIWLVADTGRVVAQGGIVDNPGVLKRGRYRTGSQCGRPARVRLNRSAHGNLYLDHFVRFAPCGIGFHRIPRHVAGGAPLHAEYYLGTDLRGESSGCVRLSARMARTVWDFTAGRVSTAVVVL